MSTADADVYKFLKYFTFLTVEAIDALAQEDAEREGRPEAQRVLAREVTRLVHGDGGLEAAERITSAMFSGDESSLSESDLAQLSLDGLPSSVIAREAMPETLTQLLTDAGMAASGKQVKDALGRSAVSINGVSVSAENNADLRPALRLGCDARALFHYTPGQEKGAPVHRGMNGGVKVVNRGVNPC